MKDKRRKLVNRRVWLRENSEWGPQSSIHTHLTHSTSQDWDWKTETKTGWQRHNISGTIGLRDCSDYVSFEIHADSDRHLNVHVNMLNKLIDELTTVRDGMLEARDTFDKWKERVPDEDTTKER